MDRDDAARGDAPRGLEALLRQLESADANLTLEAPDLPPIQLGRRPETARIKLHSNAPLDALARRDLTRVAESYLAGEVDIEGDFLVMNGDVLTTLRFNEFMAYHREQEAPATIAMHKKRVQLQLGVIHLNGGRRIKDYIEKPSMDYLVSMGIYAFNDSVLKYIPRDQHFDFPELVLALLGDGTPVMSYESDHYWADIGTLDEYAKAVVDFETRKSEFIKWEEADEVEA